MTNTPPHSQTGSPPAALAALCRELHDTVLHALEEQLRQLFAAAPAAILALMEQSQTPADRRRALDLLAVLTGEQSQLIQAFVEEIRCRLELPAAAPEASQPVQFPSLLEESIVLANIEMQCERMHGALIEDLRRRMEWMSRHLPEAPQAQALTSASLTTALYSTLEKLGVDPELRRVLYELFNRVTVPGLHTVYGRALTLLSRHGVLGTPTGAPPLTAPTGGQKNR